MKLKSILLAATLMAFFASAATAFSDDTKVEKTEVTKVETKAETETGGTKKPVKKKVKKHSHAEEKGGMPMPESKPGMDQHDSMEKIDKHDHTKDRH